MLYSKKKITVIVVLVLLLLLCLVLILLLVFPSKNWNNDKHGEVCIFTECLMVTEHNKKAQTVSSSVCIPNSCISHADFLEYGSLCIFKKCLSDGKEKTSSDQKLCLKKTCLSTPVRMEKLEKSQLCLTENCVLTASEMLKWMDVTTDPCDDFYQFACGGFLRKNSKDPAKSSSEKLTDEKISLKLRELLESPVEKEESDAFRKAKAVYTSCRDTSQSQERSAEQLTDMLRRQHIGVWPTLDLTWKDCDIDLETRMALLNVHGVDSFFRLVPEFKGINNTLTASLYIAAPLIPDICDGTFEDEDGNFTNFGMEVVKDYTELINRVYDLLDAPDNFTEMDTQELFRLDFRLCNATKDSRRHVQTYHRSKQTLQSLVSIAPHINWSRWHSIIFVELGSPLSFDKVPIYVYGVNQSIAALVEVLKSTPSRHLANYLSWKFVLHHLGYLSSPFVQIIQDYRSLLGKSIGPLEIQTWVPKWKRCVRFVRQMMPLAVIPRYVNKVVSPSLRREMKVIQGDIVKAFNGTFNKTSRLMTREKVKAIQKLFNLTFQLLYPNKDDLFYDEYYSMVELTKHKSFLLNSLALQKFRMKKLFGGIHKKINMSNIEYLITVHDPFASSTWSDFRHNRTLFSYGALLNSQLDVQHPRYLNFGSYGTTVASEVARGLDLRNFQAQAEIPGPVRNWTTWVYYAAIFAEKRFECFKNFYLANREKTHNFSSAPIVDGMMADSQGLHISYEAYRKQKKIYGDEELLPGLQHSNEQLFFLRYAQSLCNADDPQAFTNKVRANGALANTPHFGEAFLCSESKRMNPTNRCQSLES